MDLVVDANILFAAMIKGDFSYLLLFNKDFRLFMPEYVFVELEKHKQEILEKTKQTPDEFFRLLEILKTRIIFVSLLELIDFVSEADKITPDPDDMVYFALALKLNCPIWSNDKKLKEQNRIKVYHTHELTKLNEIS